ncbi:MAG: ArnT family glycosyltransferase [Candidatus Promineifilaceae bacterium]
MAIYDELVANNRQSSSRPLLATKFLPLLLVIAAFLPRLAALGRYITPDEPIWVYRSLGFRQALLASNWSDTIQSGHPGVMTTWLGAAAAQIQLWLDPEAAGHLEWIDQLYWLTPDNDVAMRHLSTFLTSTRLAVAVVTTLGLLLIYWLARRRLGPTAAFLGSLLLALDPFVAGLSGLLHVDALLGTFMLLSVLLVLPPVNGRDLATEELPRPTAAKYLALAGITTGLAILTKTPGLLLLVVIPTIQLWFHWRTGSLRAGVVSLALWALVTAITLFLFLPAFWADPRHVLEMTGTLAGRLIDSAVRPTFFLGQVTLSPGPAFYPLAVALRLSPSTGLILLGLLAWLGIQIVRRRRWPLPANATWLLIYGLSFLLFLNLSAKRFDRYALPGIMALILVAGWALARLVSSRFVGLQGLAMVSAGLLITLHAGYLLAYWPYPLTAYNWLGGGPQVAQLVLPTGWGEAASVAAQQAAVLPEAENRVLFTSDVPAAAPFFPGRSLLLKPERLVRLDRDDVLTFVDQDWQLNPDDFRRDEEYDVPLPNALAGWPVADTFRFGGLPRAVLYTGVDAGDLSLQPLTTQPRDLSFAQAMQVVSAGALAAHWPDRLPLTIGWLARQPADYQLLLELVDSDNHAWISHEQPLLNDVDHPASAWTPGVSQQVYYQLPLPADIPPGTYAIQASLFDAAGRRLGVFDATGQFRGVAASLVEVVIVPPDEQPALNIPVPIPSGTELVGRGELPDEIGNGQFLTLDLWWRLQAASPVSGTLRLDIGPAHLAAPINLEGGHVGQTYHIRPSWRIPADLGAGRYPLELQLLGSDGLALWPQAVDLGEVPVEAVERNYTLPPDLVPLNFRLGSIAKLQQARATSDGGEEKITLTWQATEPDGRSYTIFVHIMDGEGNHVDQIDRQPGLPTDAWVEGQVTDDEFLFPSLSEGTYTAAVGLYDPVTGLRLPVYGPDGARLPDDQYQFQLTVP